MEIVIILKLLLIDPTGKVWAHFPSGPRIYNILRLPTQDWECFYHSDNFIPLWPVIPIWRIECSPQCAHHLTQPKIDISCQFIKRLSLTPESSFAFHPSFSARTGSPTKSSSQPVNYRWRWWVGFLIKLSVSSWQLSLYRPVLFLAILPAPSAIVTRAPDAAIFRARVTATGGGDTRRVTAGLYGETGELCESPRCAGSGNDCEVQLVPRAESSGLIYRFIVWTRVSREQDDIFTLDQSTTWVGTTQR